MSLKVYQVAPAPDHAAQWLRRLLRPVVEAARFEHAPPLEIRPCGRWGGWSAPRDCAPDGRVALSTGVIFGSKRGIVDAYLHEAAHSLLFDVSGAEPGHDSAFFSLGMALRLRVDAHRRLEGDPVSLMSAMSLYDLADLPPVEIAQGVGECIAWSIEVATELAATDLSAEGLAHEIVKRYQAWLDQLRNQPRVDGIATRQAKAHVAMVERLRDKLFVSSLVAFVSSSMLVLITVMRVLQ